MGDVVNPLRVATTGQGVGPGLYDCLAILGRETCRARIAAIAMLEGAGPEPPPLRRSEHVLHGRPAPPRSRVTPTRKGSLSPPVEVASIVAMTFFGWGFLQVVAKSGSSRPCSCR